jgi:O-antigen/teichoic acid export membrane protein
MLLAPVAGAAPAFVPLLLGQKWEPAGAVLPLVCLGVVVLTPLMISCEGYLWAVGDAKSPLRAILTNAVLFAAVTLPLLRYLGVLAFALGLVCAALGHGAILARAVKRHAGVDCIRPLLVPLSLWLIATGAAWICAETAGPLLVRTLVSAGVAVGLYIALLVPTQRELLREAVGHARPLFRGFLERRRGTPAPAPTP